MKPILVILISSFQYSLISSFNMFNSRLNQTSNIYYSASHLQDRAHLNNINAVHHQNDVVNNNRIGFNYLREGLYQQQQLHSHSMNNNKTNRLIERNHSILNNRIIHPRFRPLFQTQKKNDALTQSTLSRSLVVIPNSNLSVIDNDYYQQEIQAFSERQHTKMTRRTYSWIKTGLRR